MAELTEEQKKYKEDLVTRAKDKGTSDFTDQEIKDYIALLNERTVGEKEIKEKIRGLLDQSSGTGFQNGVQVQIKFTPAGLEKATNKIYEKYKNTGKFDLVQGSTADLAKEMGWGTKQQLAEDLQIVGGSGTFQPDELSTLFGGVNNNIQDLNQNWSIGRPIDPLDISSAENVLKERQGVVSDQAYLEDYLANAPNELAKTREEFFKGQRKSAIDYLNQYTIPEQITPIEQTGLASDREIAKMIGNLYSGVNTNIQSQEIDQTIEDINFFSDAAYKSKLQELIKSRGDLRGQIASDFQTAQTKQQQGFLKSQQDVQNKFDLDMFQRENERALQQYQTKLKQQQDSQNKANEANLWSSIGGAVGTVGGAVVGGPVGAAIGGSVGSTAGTIKGAS